jgi:hypothetical protein
VPGRAHRDADAGSVAHRGCGEHLRQVAALGHEDDEERGGELTVGSVLGDDLFLALFRVERAMNATTAPTPKRIATTTSTTSCGRILKRLTPC